MTGYHYSFRNTAMGLIDVCDLFACVDQQAPDATDFLIDFSYTLILKYNFYHVLLPATKLREGNVFTKSVSVCFFTGGFPWDHTITHDANGQWQTIHVVTHMLGALASPLLSPCADLPQPNSTEMPINYLWQI